MRKFIVLVLIALAGLTGVILYSRVVGTPASSSAPEQAAGRSDPGAGGPGGGRGAGRAPSGAGSVLLGRPPMTVEISAASRGELAEELTLVGNLTGAATVEVVPKVNGRLQAVDVRLGDRVRRGQRLAKVEDDELLEQVKQARASFEVSRATIRQREADFKLAETTLERSRNLFTRQLISQQTLDDADARAQAAAAQLDLARAQFEQANARLEELQITLANTNIVSPVDGFVARRNLDPGAFVSPNVPVVSVVDIHLVRLVANLVERDMRRVTAGTAAVVEVDAYPGESFTGQVARVAPVLDPSTRTAPIEIEILNPENRLKPGMYARVRLTVGRRPDALVVPRNAVVDSGGLRGVFVVGEDGKTARFLTVETGLQDSQHMEILRGVTEGQQVVTTGAAGLHEGDPIIIAGSRPPERGRAGGGPPGQAPANRPPQPQGGRS